MRTALRGILAFAVLTLFVSSVARADIGLRPPAAGVARTDEGDSIEFGVYELWRYDSNLFRLPDDVDPNGDERRSAFTFTTAGGLHLDKRYGQQRLVVNATVSRDLYSSYHNLDFTNTQLDAILRWTVTPEVTGDVIIDHDRFANDYEYVGFRTAPDPRKVALDRIDIDWRAGAALHPRLSIFRREDTNSSRTFQLESSRSNSVEGSLVYTFRSNNTFTLYQRRASGEGTNTISRTTRFLDKNFEEDETGAEMTWETLGLVTMDAELGFRHRIYDTYSQRDFRGLVGNFNLTYLPTGKLAVIFFATRGLASSQTNDSSFYVNEIGTVSLAYFLTQKITIKPSFSYKRQDFRGAPSRSSFALLEYTRYAYLEADWAVTRAIDLQVDVGHANRTSNLPLLQYLDESASILARFKF